MKFHFDDTSIKILVGIIGATIIFTFVMAEFGRSVHEQQYDEDVEYDAPDNDTGYGEDEKDDWFGGGYLSDVIDGINLMKNELAKAPNVITGLFILMFLAISLIVLRSFEWGI